MDVLREDFDVVEALKNDKDGRALRAVKDSLAGSQAKLRKTMDKGLSHKDFNVANNLHKAYSTGQDLVEQFWSQPRK
jgi:hypothetical protein